MSTSFTVDGKKVTIEGEPLMPLLYALRDDLKMDNPKFGCGLAQCGACTVHVDGEAVRSCVMPISAVANKNITTFFMVPSDNLDHTSQIT